MTLEAGGGGGVVQFQTRKSFLIKLATDEHPVVLEIFEPKITITCRTVITRGRQMDSWVDS